MRDWRRVKLLWNSWTNPNIHHLGVKHRRLPTASINTHNSEAGMVVMVIQDEFKSQPCTNNHLAYNGTLEWLRCCELPESVHTHSILVWKVNTGQANFNSNSNPTHIVVIRLEPTAQSQPPPTIHYTKNDRLEGSSCCEILEPIQT